MPITLQRTFERIFYSSIGQRIVYWLDRYPVRRWLPAFVLIYIAAHGFAELAGDVWLREGFVWDRPVILLIHQFSSPTLDQFFLFVTSSAGQWLWVPFGVALFVFWRLGWIRELLLLLISVVGNIALDTLLKAIFTRPRPDVITPLVTETSFSFPSGHTAVAVALYGMLALLLWQRRHWLVGAVCMMWMLLIGLSRIYLGAHYPSDVVGSLAFSVVWVLMLLLIEDKRAIDTAYDDRAQAHTTA